MHLILIPPAWSSRSLSNSAGEVTSHIQGFLNRTIRMLECGIKPIYVFDGKPPALKQETLAARAHKKSEAEGELHAALEGGDDDEIRKAATRTIRATPEMNADVQELLQLLGCPVVIAPSEAEARRVAPLPTLPRRAMRLYLPLSTPSASIPSPAWTNISSDGIRGYVIALIHILIRTPSAPHPYIHPHTPHPRSLHANPTPCR